MTFGTLHVFTSENIEIRVWRGRFAEQGLAGRADHRRCGRPARFTPVHGRALGTQAEGRVRRSRRPPRPCTGDRRGNPRVGHPWPSRP
ncbi:helix-turn-helix domain-containing protein [Actinacidiphila oryziradicis]|uniref:Helix-turn-helix domain-containing protein n=1 Tax=Actinacidiphila oryziradicis TaxID=2571141 RepID=A0A4U0RK24_9ACTN|nr:helix-turn-helix domain-containing protein [Actinacidiphila oryziradicis]